ncbi:hypothetical protein DUNSADRAFT_17130 [Dunaliella salina]|uniref:Uncharacterized protein n=1 Tax=Dunaliella salina TaxID=3046 RepID=A0ABQ7G2C2_DUNSA|nr:hypothetical protein DUNSADRAFT_17130 [Dunaliella salina]|eukprot:KAF5828752.1 hypothetical protein DUNSADRAFT_17130 [Dunaliella salina]
MAHPPLAVNMEKTNHHISTSAPFHSTLCFQNDVPFSKALYFQSTLSPANQGRFEGIAPQANRGDNSGMGEVNSQQSGMGRGRGGGRGGGWTGRGGRGQGGFPDSGKSPEEKVPSLEVCILNAATAAQQAPNWMAYCMYNLAKRIDMDIQGRVQYKSSSSECADMVDAARKLIRYLLGESASSGAQASNSQAPVQQLDSKHLSLLVWSLSVMGGFDESLSAGARQLCYALAERAAQPTVVRAWSDVACRNWAGLLYGLAKAGVKCSDDARLKQLFYFCMEQDLPGLLLEGQKCVPQDVSNVALACVDAEYGGSMQLFISAVARRVGEPSMGGVGGGLMANAAPQAWSNLLYACAKLEQR